MSLSFECLTRPQRHPIHCLPLNTVRSGASRWPQRSSHCSSIWSPSVEEKQSSGDLDALLRVALQFSGFPDFHFNTFISLLLWDIFSERGRAGLGISRAPGRPAGRGVGGGGANRAAARTATPPVQLPHVVVRQHKAHRLLHVLVRHPLELRHEQARIQSDHALNSGVLAVPDPVGHVTIILVPDQAHSPLPWLLTVQLSSCTSCKPVWMLHVSSAHHMPSLGSYHRPSVVFTSQTAHIWAFST